MSGFLWKNIKQSTLAKILTILSIVMLFISFLGTLTVTALNSRLNTSFQEEYDLYSCCEEYRSASEYLIREVRAYAVTGEQAYYDAYLKEKKTDMRRENSISKMYEIGLYEEEIAMIEAIVATGEQLAIMGPSGSGKTTLLSLVGGIIKHSEGKVIFSRELDSVKGNIHKVQTSFPEEVSKEDFADIDNIEILSLKSSGSVTALVVKGSTEDIEKAMEGKNARFCDIIPLSLEEIFIYEMKGAGYNYEID